MGLSFLVVLVTCRALFRPLGEEHSVMIGGLGRFPQKTRHPVCAVRAASLGVDVRSEWKNV